MKQLLILTFLFVFLTSFGQTASKGTKTLVIADNQEIVVPNGPEAITRNIIQDKKGNIWMAAFDGIFRFDGKKFFNVTHKITKTRFFSILEDSNGNFWFGTIGGGIYFYDGKSFTNFSTKDGLINNEITVIYEDKRGNIWFGGSGGASCFDGKTFKNFSLDADGMRPNWSGLPFTSRQPFEVNSIKEDPKGYIWFATRDNTYVFDRKTFTAIINPQNPLKNVRTLTLDKNGNMWLAGQAGLWRYKEGTYKNFNTNFVGYIIEDKKGNLWTSSEKDRNRWAVSRYNSSAIDTETPASDIAFTKMAFGILEAKDGSIWFGDIAGVHRFDGTIVIDYYKPKEK